METWHLPLELKYSHGVDSWNARQQPDHASQVVAVIRAGQEFKVLEKHGDWLHVDLDGVEGWMDCRLPVEYGHQQALVPRKQSSFSCRSLQRTLSTQDRVRDLLAQYREQRAAYERLSRQNCGPELMRVAVALEHTVSHLDVLGISPDDLHAEAARSDVGERLVAELCRTSSYEHTDFANPRSESCWLSTFFQSLWHSRVFHAAFEFLQSPAPGSALQALQRTWQMYQEAAASGGLVPVNELVKAWGSGYGDCAEAFAKFHHAEDLKAFADLFAFVPVPWTGGAPDMAQLEQLVESVGVAETPLLVLDLAFPPLTPASMESLALTVRPRRIGHDLKNYRMISMGCYMEEIAHYVVYCRSLSKPDEWIFFNDLPRLARGAPRRLNEWEDVAATCSRYSTSPRMLLYENPEASLAFLKKRLPAA